MTTGAMHLAGTTSAHVAYSEDAEQAVLAAMLMDGAAIAAADKRLRSSDFYRTGHRLLFDTMRAMWREGRAVDPITLHVELDDRDELEAVGGKDYIGFLIDAVPTAANVAYHARVVRRKAAEREATTLRRNAQLSDVDCARQLSALAADLDPATPDDTDAPAPALRAIDAIEGAVDEAAVTWVARDFWPADIGMIIGEGGSFKSSAALHFAGAVAGGYAVFNRFATERRPVLVVSAEDSAAVVLMRLEAFVAGQGWDRRRVLENVHIIASAGASLADSTWQQHLRDEVKRIQPGLILFDPLAELIAGNENDPSAQRPTLKFVRSLATLAGAGVVIVHHASKPVEGRKMIDRSRGASSFQNAARVAYFVESSDNGVTMHQVKHNRTEKLPTFVVIPEIETSATNRGLWSSARLTCKDAAAMQETLAEAFVLTQLEQCPGLGSTELRKAAEGTGVSAQDVSIALRRLEDRGRIEYEAGPRNAKHWRVRACQTHSSGSQNDPAEPAHTLTVRLADTRSSLPTPLGVAGRLDRSCAPVRLDEECE